MSALLTEAQRTRVADSARAVVGMADLCATLEAEVEAILAAHPELPRTPQMRCVLWALVRAVAGPVV